jgi:hypothetical protein
MREKDSVDFLEPILNIAEEWLRQVCLKSIIGVGIERQAHVNENRGVHETDLQAVSTYLMCAAMDDQFHK